MTENIEVRVVVYRCGHNRRLKGAYIADCPAYIRRHIGCNFRHNGDAKNLLIELAVLGHSYSIKQEYEDVSSVEWADLIDEAETPA